MKKWAYPLLIAFVAFFILSNPAQSGTQGRAFVIWLGDLAGAAGEFLDGLFDDDNDPGNNNNLIPGGGDDGNAADTGDTNGGSTDNGSDQPVTPEAGDGNNNGGNDGGDSFETLAVIRS